MSHNDFVSNGGEQPLGKFQIWPCSTRRNNLAVTLTPSWPWNSPSSCYLHKWRWGGCIANHLSAYNIDHFVTFLNTNLSFCDLSMTLTKFWPWKDLVIRHTLLSFLTAKRWMEVSWRPCKFSWSFFLANSDLVVTLTPTWPWKWPLVLLSVLFDNAVTSSDLEYLSKSKSNWQKSYLSKSKKVTHIFSTLK